MTLSSVKRDELRPVRKLGAGISGVTFLMTDGSVVKLIAIGKTHDTGAALTPGGEPIPEAEFRHEVECTYRAASLFNRIAPHVFRVPQVYEANIVRTPEDGRTYGIIHMELISGRPIVDVLKDARAGAHARTRAAERWGRALGEIHRAGVAHGDYHGHNAMVEDGTGAVIILDWARAQWLGPRTAKSWTRLVNYDLDQAGRSLAKRGLRHATSVFRDAYVRAAERVDRVPSSASVFAHARHAFNRQAMKQGRRRVRGEASGRASRA